MPPQYPMLGTGLDLPLLDWLNAYAFPAEARMADTDYARDTYRRLARELIENGTTRVAMFSSLHTDATLILMEELEKAGIEGFVGKVNMDRNSAPRRTGGDHGGVHPGDGAVAGVLWPFYPHPPHDHAPVHPPAPTH